MPTGPRWLLVLLLVVGTAGCTGRSGGPSSPASSVAGASSLPDTPAPGRSTPPRLRPSGVRPAVAPVSAVARADGLIDVRTVVPDAIIDLRYATTDNFTHVRLYALDARCLVHRTMGDGLRVAANRLRRKGLRLVFWDCYRPHTVQVRMFRVVPDPIFVARPRAYARSHEAGRSVDITLARGSERLDMGTGFDDFSARAGAYATDGVSSTARANRETLRHALEAGGLRVYVGEWWHFDGPGADTPRPYLRAAVD